MARLAVGHGVTPVVIPLGVDTGVFKAAARAGADPPWHLLNVASLNPVKDHRTLVEAFRHVVDRIGGAVFLQIAGEDTMNGAIQDAVRQLGLERHVTFHGVLPSQALAELYRTADLLVLSSRHEAAGVVALEAAASNIPIVGTSVGYVADWAPTSAVAVPIADSRALADAIIRLLHDAGERRRIADSAREWAVAHDADWTAAEFTRLYNSLT
jgi:glycosyltransferase involved in cell wall biosynthesis